MAVNKETYISLHPQELNTCKRIGYEHFCEELFVVKTKHRYSCASAVYFNLEEEIKNKTVNVSFTLTLSVLHATVVLLSHLVKKAPLQ